MFIITIALTGLQDVVRMEVYHERKARLTADVAL